MKNNIAIEIKDVKKQYRLGQIGGGTLQGDLQSWWARKRGKEDPNSKIGSDQRLIGQTFMALNGINLTIHKGEAVGIIGKNGAGKSTLLKLLSRVTAPTEGTIDIYGRITSMLEVGTGFHGEMTGRENVYMNGAILGMTRAEIDAKMDHIIEFSEVGDFIDTPVKRYSSGMYVKLAFSVAAHLDSEIMIMDEVLAVGDMAFQQKCLDKMSDASRTEGKTVLYVSHNMNTIRRLCTRCVVLDEGKIVFDGDVEEAISIYLNTRLQNNDVNIDISDKRMDHLPKKADLKLMRLILLDKDNPLFEMNEQIKIQLFANAFRDIDNVSIRFEIRTIDGFSVGTAFIHNFDSLKPGSVEWIFELKLKGLIEGKYNVLLVVYELNKFGSYNDLDAVFPAFSFEIVNQNDRLNINWNKRDWGHILFEEIKYVKE